MKMKKLVAFILAFIFAMTLCSCNTLKLYKLSDTYFIMDTPCTITAGSRDDASLKEAIQKAFNKVCEIESYTDYYLPSSDVSKVNFAKADEAITVSDDTINILQIALDVCEKSNGSFDITIAPLKDIWGFKEEVHTIPTDNDVSTTLSLVDYKNIHIDTENKTVTKKNDLTKIDLGGCAKGYAADKALEILKEHNIEYALIDFGGNILTYGHNPANHNGKWLIGIQKPFSQNGEYSNTISVENKAVVTSGTYQRYFEEKGNIYHHILDPDTGYPTDNGIKSATIISDNALIADCLSTASVVLGEEQAKKLAKEYDSDIYIIDEKN